MKLTTTLSLIAAGVLLTSATLSIAEELKMHKHDQGMKKRDSAMTTPLKDEGTQKTCPVMGNSVDKNIFVDYRGKRIYFCCSACPAQFRKDPATYLKKLSENGEKPALLALAPQKTCPVMENPIDKKVFVDHKGKRVYFCCLSCKTEFKKDPEKYLKKLSKMGEAPESL